MGIISKKQEPVGTSRLSILLLGTVVALLFVFFRVLGAYWAQDSTNGDYAVVVLMAKHMAQGVDFPLFFYGQSYLGSLEPMVSALLCKIVGFSSFTVCMGTVLFSVAMIPFVYLYGRNCGGWGAGLAALLFCAIGPSGFFDYASSPRGGYAALLFFTVLILWALLEITHRESNGDTVSIWAYTGIGIVGGISWWVDPLITPAIFAGSIVYVAYLRGGAFTRKGPYAAAGGFLVGLLPFFVWNANNGWRSLKMVDNTTRSIDLTKGFRLFLARCTQLLDFHDKPWYVQGLFTLIYAGAVVLVVRSLIDAFRKDRVSRRTIGLVLLLVFPLIFALCFAISDFSTVKTGRYLLPLVPAIGVMLGCALARMKGIRQYLAILLLVGLSVFQWTQLAIFAERRKLYDQMLVKAEGLADYLVEKEIKDVYGLFQHQHLNYALDEKFLVCNAGREPYEPYLDRMERASTAAILDNKDSTMALLRSVGAEFKQGTVPGYDLIYDIRRSEGVGVGVGLAAGDIASIVDGSGIDVRDALMDRCLLSGVSLPESLRVSAREFTLKLREPVSVTGLRYLCRPEYYPRIWSLYGRASTSEEWQPLLVNTEVSPFFWSGQRIYARGAFFRVDGVCEPTVCSELKITFPESRGGGVRISELQILASRQEADSGEPAAIGDLALWLDRAEVGTVYADRWESNQLVDKCECKVVRDRDRSSANVRSDGVPVVLSRDIALVVKRSDLDWSLSALKDFGLNMAQDDVGPWTVLSFRGGLWRSEYERVSGLLWVGFGCVSESRKHAALELARRAVEESKAGAGSSSGLSRMRRALEIYPNYRDGVGRMAVWEETAGRVNESRAWRAQYESMWQPQIDAQIDFAGRAQLVGVSVSKVAVAPGESLSIDYYWRCKPRKNLRSLVVFAHFKRDKETLFQDDRPLLSDEDIDYQPFDEVFIERRNISVPYDVKSGECELWLGIYDVEEDNRRVNAWTRLTKSRESVLLPIVVQIGAH